MKIHLEEKGLKVSCRLILVVSQLTLGTNYNLLYLEKFDCNLQDNRYLLDGITCKEIL